MYCEDNESVCDSIQSGLRNNNLYGKHALCRFLLVSIENQGKEKLKTDNLSIEHIMALIEKEIQYMSCARKQVDRVCA